MLITMLALSPLMTLASAGAQNSGAQDQGKRPETTGSASGLPQGVLPAPVGHRQPRASDVPANTPKISGEQTQVQRDHELDKELWICRGCGAPP